MEKQNTKAKIVITVVVLLSTLALAALGTFAWFTLSQRGDIAGLDVAMVRTGDEWPFEFIEQRDNDNWATIGEVWDAASRSEEDGWGKHVTLGYVHFVDENNQLASKSADDCYQLRPISTSDLENWFLPEYDGIGQVSYLTKATFSAVANINRYSPTISETGKDIPSNYIYYFDLWVRTLSKKYDYDLHLNNPLNTSNQYAFDYEEDQFGTYVLPALVANNGSVEVNKAGFDMSKCLRIGFAIYDTDPDDITKATISDYYIYEPNCDSRAKYFTQFSNEAGNYEMQKNYVYVLGQDADSNKIVKSQLSIPEGATPSTLLPYLVAGETYQSFKDIDEGVAEADKKTIRQLTSYWKSSVSYQDVANGQLDGSDIQTMGGFLNKASGRPEYQGVDTPTMTTVYRGTPVHIRVFVWMEGQDVDCWNSSLAGKLKIGLEFRGEEAGGS